jgi:hypothetical protein
VIGVVIQDTVTVVKVTCAKVLVTLCLLTVKMIGLKHFPRTLDKRSQL